MIMMNSSCGPPWNIILAHLSTHTHTHTGQRCQGISLPLALLMVTICWRIEGLAFSWGAAACFMPALAALAQVLALTHMPSAPATAIRTARGQGLAHFIHFTCTPSLSGLCHVKCDADGKLNRSVLIYAAKEFSAAVPRRPSGINKVLLNQQGYAITE